MYQIRPRLGTRHATLVSPDCSCPFALGQQRSVHLKLTVWYAHWLPAEKALNKVLVLSSVKS